MKELLRKRPIRPDEKNAEEMGNPAGQRTVRKRAIRPDGKTAEEAGNPAGWKRSEEKDRTTGSNRKTYPPGKTYE